MVPSPTVMFHCVNIKHFLSVLRVPFLFYRQSRHWARQRGQGMNLSLFWANLDHPDSGDRTFESPVESPRNSSLKKFPGVSTNAPGWAKVIRYLLISIPIKENLLLGKRKVQSCGPIWLFSSVAYSESIYAPEISARLARRPEESGQESQRWKRRMCVRGYKHQPWALNS